MGRYSSDSDSDLSSRHRRKHHRRSRSSSTDSSDSSSYRRRSKHSKSKRHRRTCSRSRDKDRTSRSHRSSRGSSRDRDKRHRSPESKAYVSERSKNKFQRSVSREKSTSRSSSSQSNVKIVNIEDRSNSTLLNDGHCETKIKDSVLDEINSEKWVPKQFTSSSQSKHTKSSNIIIDITADTIKIPPVVTLSETEESIFHPSITLDQESRFERWVKKLYTLRQKAITELNQSSIV